MSQGYDPIERTKVVRERVCREGSSGQERLYYRFRGGRWYGGIASADVIGCNLSCKFCWAWYFRDRYNLGNYFTSEGAFRKLRKIAVGRRYNLMRLTGGEPTICRDHLIRLVELALASGYGFILETNGLLLGHDMSYAKELSSYDDLLIRVSFKGVNPEEFSELTGAKPSGFDLQLSALRNLLDYGIKPCRNLIPAIMVSFSKDEDIAEFVMKLSDMDEDLPRCIDWEVVILYPHVEKILRKTGLRPRKYLRP